MLATKTAPAQVTVYLDNPMHGVESHITVENRQTGLQTVIEVISRIDLNAQEMRDCISKTLGNRWDYKFLGIQSFPYEF